MLAPADSLDQTDHDMRHLNRMSAETKYAHGYLIRWGEWSRDIGVRAWPPRTLLGKIMDEGPHGALTNSHPPIAEPAADVAATEAVVKRLCQIDQRVLKVEYVEPWAMRNIKAKQAHMKPSKYERTLRRARERVYLLLISTAELSGP